MFLQRTPCFCFDKVEEQFLLKRHRRGVYQAFIRATRVAPTSLPLRFPAAVNLFDQSVCLHFPSLLTRIEHARW